MGFQVVSFDNPALVSIWYDFLLVRIGGPDLSSESDQHTLHETISLLKMAKAGDTRAVADLYSRFGDRLQAVVRLRLGSRLRAKVETCDIVQETLLAALPQLEKGDFPTSGALFHWLTRLAENRIRDLADHFGAQKRDAGRERPLEVRNPNGDYMFGPIADIATTGTPSMYASRKEEIEALERAIDSLPDEQREALILVRYEGMSLAEAGAVMNRSADAVRMMVSRALVKLGGIMQST